MLVSSAISGELLTRYGTSSQQREWLPRMASGDTKMAFAITEPDAGSNTRQIATTAVRDGGDYVLNGTKYYISGVDEAGAIVVVARSAPQRLSLFVVPTDTAGLVKHRLPVGINLPEKQYTLHFDDVRVPASQLLGVEHEGFNQVFDGLNPERITGAAVCVGIGRHAVEKEPTTRANGRCGAHLSAPIRRSHIRWPKPRSTSTWPPSPPAAPPGSSIAGCPPERHPTSLNTWPPRQRSAPSITRSNYTVEMEYQPSTACSRNGVWPDCCRSLRSAEMILNYVAQHSLNLPRSY